MNEIPKVIFSKTLKEANWNRSRVVSGDIKEEVSRLKQQPGNYILAHGGARFAQSLSRFDLIDEYRLIIHPVVLGKGQPLFKNLADMINLKLLNTRVFHTGVVLHTYQPVRKGGSPQEN
ncbi:dihydrofolate reductase family protein [Oceanobacillus kimchii]|uniref:dihydrofolate reductase family protein n=1 Tax=Oceanobacillus kimchii TaxID=746691 RepID=UPI003B01A04E